MSGKNQCSYCYRSFARSEHLSRHERSHRNERPYRCPSCSGTFTRKDVFKRHHTRHHGQPVQASPQQQQHAPGPSNVDPPISLQAGLTPTSSHGAVSVTTRDGMESSSATGFDQADLLLMNSSIMDSLVSVLDYPAVPRSDLFSNLTGQAHQHALAGASRGESGPAAAGAPQVGESPGWKGSFAISEQKRGQLAAEVDPTEEFNVLAFPSRLTWERLLNTFAECFLIYIPCIHTPTWKADLAPPCTIFAMASIGASYHDDNTTATWLHRLATACLKKYVRKPTKPPYMKACILTR
ncbi:hypothetical protein Asppvi_010389 [Aspergillus pseudoviridinutans]|uniref:C2H2-type domain-containing protein n=1 Tax=Aspergillus pseudoviridinutans TaxID=1517512 RepID=A0A9P3BPA8_9EURO|nr:uncharacterized protein Asppvi_010389 [Aspergillus pseudoviridinutans]GIJ91424.1 hypothetical protein Asppvi_010389 [Aspergillus pseudoviridinutans]